MSTATNILYRLNRSEGSLSWSKCNRVNAELVKIHPSAIPKHQIQNVCETSSKYSYGSLRSPNTAKNWLIFCVTSTELMPNIAS
jgi:hypothetical protein